MSRNHGRLGGETFVPVVQAADFRDGDDSSRPAMLNRAGVGAILAKREMRAGALVIVDVRGQDAAQMAFVEDHDVIQTLATYRTDHALDVRVLPGRAWRRDDLGHAYSFDPVAEVRAIRRVAIAQQVARSRVSSESFRDLARAKPRSNAR